MGDSSSIFCHAEIYSKKIKITFKKTIKINIKFISKFFTKNILCTVSKKSERSNRVSGLSKNIFFKIKIIFSNFRLFNVIKFIKV